MRKYMKKKIREVYFYGESVEDAIGALQVAADGLIDPVVSEDDFLNMIVVGWVPMTPAERNAVDRKNEKEKMRKAEMKKKAEAAERAEYERLKKKFDGATAN